MIRKIFLLLTLFTYLYGASALAASRAKLIEDSLAYQEEFQRQEYNQRHADIKNLTEAKTHLIDGNLLLAKHFLGYIHESNSLVGLVKKRYLALVHFIEGDYKKTLKLLENKVFLKKQAFRETCMMKMFSYLALGDTKNIITHRNRCQAVTEDFSRNNQMWLLNLIDLSTSKKFMMHPGAGISNTYLTQGTEVARIWLKMALYSNREQSIDFFIGSLPSDAYRSRRVREIIAYAYYRMNEYDKAMSFTEGLTTANSENIKGNIKLEKREYELAFGHFKLALTKKANSRNAIERAIPLAWKLGRFQDGKDLLIKHVDTDFFAKRALDIAFDIRLDDMELARKKVRLLNRNFLENRPYKLVLMNSYISTKLNEPKNKRYFSENACRKFDGLNCWLKFQHTMWPSISKTIKREGTIFTLKEFSVNNLRKKVVTKEMDETININQNDIEELDSAEVIVPLTE
ncbi:MAG: hypothetical protein KAG61_04550 [Bacteriovoracaceae bacterium]|nr:hypothetical protein [Bacteriovoracaceae bacterium]